MKLVIQIPCYNEQDSLPIALAELPRTVEGFDEVEWLIIDDGSVDRTVEVALANGVDHVARHTVNSGLAVAFMTGLEASLRAGADVIVNTDADNQYRADDIPALVAPVLAGEADMVVGARPISEIEHFSPSKKFLQGLGSWAVRAVSRTTVPDAPSGFRAISRKAALRMNVFNQHTYTLETLIQAGQQGMSVATVPVRVNADLRESRLVKSISHYIRRSVVTMVRGFMTYKPLKFFMMPGLALTFAGLLVGARFLYFFFTGEGGGHVQSLILTAVLMIVGFQLMLFGLLADLSGVNRKQLEEVQLRLRRLEFGDTAVRVSPTEKDAG